MRPIAAVVAAAAAVAVAAALPPATRAHADAPTSRFTFHVPAGWTDLSPGAPEANFAAVPKPLLDTIRARPMAFYAFDLTSGDDGFLENVNANVVVGAEPITPAIVAAALRDVDNGLRAMGGRYESLEQSTVEIDGVTVGRAVGVMHLGPIVSKQLAYLLPGDDQSAIVTYSSTPEAFDRYLPIFEDAVRKTRGLEPPSTFWGRVLRSAGRGALFGGIASAIAVTLFGLVRRRRARAA
jgi:hypothetical protein